ncbi:MAG: XRE family transcriptional regulator, partial [Chloroflexi bacterium]
MAYVMVGELLRRHRLELGLTQKVIADKVGYDNTVVSRIERGELLPSEEFVTRFVDGLSLPDAEADEIWGVYRRTKEPGANIETKRPFLTDWGEAPDVRVFYGRYEELTTLAKWLADDDCRLVSVLGMGGIGKTALAAKVAKQTAVSFDYMIWRSLRNAPPLDEILTELLQLLSNQQEVELPHDSEKAITKIIGYLSKHQCLLVLDNVESIMREGHAGDYREEYWEYGRFFQRVGESDHKSHLLLTSREKPKEIGYLEGDAYPVRVMQLAGLEAVEGQQVLAAKSLSGSELAVQSLVSHYSGNPLALNLVAEMIREVYGGHIDAFLEDDEVIFGRIGDVIGEQFARLSPLEQSLMYWLAIEREPVSRNILLKNLVIPVTKRELMIALRSLRRRSLVEMNDATFTLQNVVMEFVTDRLIENSY